MGDIANEINGFISEHNARRRGMQDTRDIFPAVQSTYYAPSLMFSDQATNGPPTQSINMSIASSSTYVSSCFDKPTPRTASVLTKLSPVPISPSLVCEFIGLGGCDEVFDSSNEAGWIAHIAEMHLHHMFPATCICWFCDRTFRAPSYSRADTEACYGKRMHHIAKHLRDNLAPRSQMRPDFYFLNHLHDCGLIDEEMFQRATIYHEVPQIPDLYPAGSRPGHDQRPAQMETSRSRRRKSQRYYC
jgi:hypothetical protein